MNKDEIKNRFKQTKLGRKIFKRYYKSLIIFVITHVLMLISLILFVTQIGNIAFGKISIVGLIFGILLFISAISSFIYGFLLVYYDGKIVGCVELFDLFLKVQKKNKE